MIALHLLEHTTQVVVAKKKKEKLVITDFFYLNSGYLDDFLQCDVSQLTEMFRQLDAEIKNVHSEQVYIVIPDSAFQRIDCFDYSDNINVYQDEIPNLSDCYYTQPIELKRTTKHKQTSCFITKDKIDTLCKAAEVQNIRIYSIEAASFAMLRVLGKWKNEVILLNAAKKHSYISSYSIMAGMYTTILPDDLMSDVNSDPDAINNVLEQIFITTEYTNKTTFGNNNPNVPTYIITENSSIHRLPVLAERKGKVEVPEVLKEITADELAEYMAPVGTIMQLMPVDTGSSALMLHSSNVMPQDKLSSNKFKHFKETLKKVCKYTVVAAGLISLVEVGGIAYLSMDNIPQDLEASYNEAKLKMPELESIDSRITQCQSEDEHIPEALYALIAYKPQDLGFTQLAIGTKGSANKDASKANKAKEESSDDGDDAKDSKKKAKAQKKKAEKWISFDVRTPNPITIQEYVNTLNQFDIFDAVITEEISAESKKDSSYQSAKIHILKGNIANE